MSDYEPLLKANTIEEIDLELVTDLTVVGAPLYEYIPSYIRKTNGTIIQTVLCNYKPIRCRRSMHTKGYHTSRLIQLYCIGVSLYTKVSRHRKNNNSAYTSIFCN